jgi:type IV secretion system protein VirB10
MRAALSSSGQVTPFEVNPMRSNFLSHLLPFALLVSFAAAAPIAAQESPNNPPQATPAPPATATTPSSTSEKIIVPIGTRLPLLLRNGINTRTAKQGDSVYFETLYPIAVNNRIAIPMGSFVRGEILEVKRPGRLKGRGEFRIAIEQMTFPNGYTIELKASPNSVDRDGREGVDAEGKIKGPSSAGRDTAMVLLATGGGAYLGTLVGAITNGAPGRGALIGGGAAGLGTLIAVLATRGPEAELPRGTTLDIVFDRPLILDPAYLPANAGIGVDPQLRDASPPADARQDLKELQKKRITQSLLRSILLHPF